MGFDGGYGVAVARELVELSVRVRLPVVTPKSRFYKGFLLFNLDYLNLSSTID